MCVQSPTFRLAEGLLLETVGGDYLKSAPMSVDCYTDMLDTRVYVVFEIQPGSHSVWTNTHQTESQAATLHQAAVHVRH